MDSLSSRKKIKIPKARNQNPNVSRNDISSRKEKEQMVDDWLNEKESDYYDSVEVPVQDKRRKTRIDYQEERAAKSETRRQSKKSNGWFGKIFLSGLDLNEGETKDVPVNDEDENIFPEYAEDVADKNLPEETLVVESIEIEPNVIREGTSRSIRVTSDVEEAEGEGGEKYLEETVEIISESEEIDKEYERPRLEENLSANQEEELVFLVREAENFFGEINDFDWDKAGYLEDGKRKAIEIALEAHIRKLINFHSTELRDMPDDLKEEVIKDIANIIMESDER